MGGIECHIQGGGKMSKNWQNCKDLIYRIIGHNIPHKRYIRGGTATRGGPLAGV
jgi:hypothetical protein